MTGRTLRSTLAALVATGLGALLVMALLVMALLVQPSSAAVTASRDCNDEAQRVVMTRNLEREASARRVAANNDYREARDAQRSNPSPRNKQRAQRFYGDWQRAIEQHEGAKRTNQAAKRDLRECERR